MKCFIYNYEVFITVDWLIGNDEERKQNKECIRS